MRCLGRLALAEAIAGRLRRAAGCANRALALAGSGAAAGRLQPATVDLALAWVGTERADGQQSRGSTAAAATNPETGRDPVAVGALALVRSRLARGRGDLVGAVTALRQARAADPPPPRWLRDRIDAAEAMVLVAQGRAEAALGLLSRPSAVSPAGSAQRAGAGGPGDPAGRGGAGGPARPEDPAAELVLARGWAQLETGAVAAAADAVRQAAQRSRLPLDVQVDTLLLAAAVELGESRPEVAREALGRAARLAEPERLRRPFQQAMPRLRRILREQDVLAEYSWWAGTGATGAHRVGPPHRVGAHPAAAGGPGAAPHADPAVIVQPLTEREREVLTHLAALLSTEEIAGRMFLSVNTVKTHVRAILRKLAAERRNEAVRRARKLGLV
jgi:LuxR family maltose regulon positive regulatory protein